MEMFGCELQWFNYYFQILNAIGVDTYSYQVLPACQCMMFKVLPTSVEVSADYKDVIWFLSNGTESTK